MGKRIDKVKQHLREHKEYYIGVGTGLAIAGITCVIMRRGTSSEAGVLAKGVKAAGVLAKSQGGFSSFISGDNNVVSPVTNNYGHGSMSKIVSIDGTNRWFQSQADAARSLGLLESDISKHLNHGKPLPGDISLTRRGVSA